MNRKPQGIAEIPWIPSHLAQDLSEFSTHTSAHKCLHEQLLQIYGERCNTLMPLAGPAWLHSLLSDTC